MITYKDFILVKGKYYDISIPFDVTGFTGFNCELFTNSKIKITPANIAFDDGKVIITFNPETLDDGVLYYELTYYVDNVLQIKCTNTPFVIRTPEGYSAQTADVIYASGETAGAEAQKALLTGATIVENGEYVRPDGYSAVTVNVNTGSTVSTTSMTVDQDVETIESETGQAWSAVTVDATQFGQDKYNSGYTNGYETGCTNGYESGYTDGVNAVPLQEKTLELSYWISEYYPDSGYSGMSKVIMDLPAFVAPFEQEAWRQGEQSQKDKLSGITITENGIYTRENGYSAVTVNIPTNIDVISTAFTMTADTQSVESETGKAFTAVTVDASQYGQDKYSSGYTSGYTDASALMPLITGTSYAYVRGDDNQITLSAETGTAFSSVTVDASQKFTDGYLMAVEDLESNAVELSVSANGIYNADIQYETRGYIKKVNVNVSGGTQEPFFGKVADFTGVGFAENSFNLNYLLEFEFICPDYTNIGGALVIAAWDGNGDQVFYKYDSNINKNVLSSTIATAFTAAQNIQNVPIKLQIYRNSIYQSQVSIEVPGDSYNYTGQSATVGRNAIVILGLDYDHGIAYPKDLPCYFKSYKMYSNDVRNGGTLLKYVVPRSDGKMWDLVSNQETDIVFDKYDGTHPTTFNTLYEWEIS